MHEKQTGIFGSIKEETQQSDYQYIKPVDENDPDSIYNLLFKDYDKESYS